MKWILVLVLCWPLTVWAGDTGGAASSVLVKTAALGHKTVKETVTGYGTVMVAPDASQSVNAGEDAIVNAIRVSPGDTVRAGQTLLTVSPAPAARNAYRQALAAVDYARQELQRQQRLRKRQLATRSDVAAARKALSDARATLEMRRSEGGGQEHFAIKAPFDGVVTAVAASTGQQLTRGSALLTLARNDRFQVRVGVPAPVAARLKKGAAVTVTPLFGGGKPVQASVSGIQGTVNPTTGMVTITIAIDGKAARGLMAGMPVSGAVTVSSSSGLAVPRNAVLSDKKGSYLFTISGGKAHRVAVRAGIQDHGWVAVSGPGLSAGQTVAVLGNYELHDGDRVRESN